MSTPQEQKRRGVLETQHTPFLESKYCLIYKPHNQWGRLQAKTVW